jgi:hypothetical protein
MSERSPERAWIATAIEQLAAAQERERSLTEALERAAGIERDAADAVDATERGAEVLAAHMKQAAMAGAEVPSAVPDDVRHAAIARSRLEAAQSALAEITSDLESARNASVEAARALDRSTSRVLVTSAEALIAQALEAQATVERLKLELYAIDRSGGAPGPNGEHVPFAFPKEGIGLIRDLASRSPQALGSSGVDINAPMERWKSYRAALKSDPDAQIDAAPQAAAA